MQEFRIIKDEQTGIERIDYWSEHWYRVGIKDIDGNEIEYPSVSRVISDTRAKGYALEEWFKSVGLQANVILKQAQESGSKIHDAIERMLKGECLNAIISGTEYYDKAEWQILNNWYAWWVDLVETLNAKPLYVEVMTFCPEWGVAGTIDLVAEIGKDRWLMDWKSGKSIYDSSEVQVGGAYAKMWNDQHPDEPVNRVGIVHVRAGNKGKKAGTLNNKGIQVKELELPPLADEFNDCVRAFKRRFPNAKSPTSQFPLELQLTKGILKKEEVA